MFRIILVAVDGTPTSNRGLAAAVGLAKEQGATLHVLHVVDELVIAPMLDGGAMGAGEYVDAMLESLRKSGRKIITNAERTASRAVLSLHAEMVSSRGQSVASAILRYAKRIRADLIVLGTHGRRGISRLVMGSDAEAVLHETTVPLLLVRSPESAHSRARPPESSKAGSKSRSVPGKPLVMPGL